MEFCINGRFLSQRITGVQRYAWEMLNALDRLLEGKTDVRVTVWTPRLPIEKPAWRNLRIKSAGWLRGNLWEQIELPILSRGCLLFCPGNTGPLLSLLGLAAHGRDRARPLV